MANYVTLMGAEDVRSAANTMLSAASEIRAAASSIDGSLEQHRRFLDDWLLRFTEAMQIASPPVATIRSGGDEAMEASPATGQPPAVAATPVVKEPVPNPRLQGSARTFHEADYVITTLGTVLKSKVDCARIVVVDHMTGKKVSS